MRTHLVQFDIAWEDPPRNFDRVRSLVAAARVNPGDMVVLPEMFDTGFSFNIAVTADRDGRSEAFCRELALQYGVFVIGGLTAVGPDGRGMNRAIAVSPDGQVRARYHKSRLFPLGRPSEAECFSPGQGVSAFEWNAGADVIRVCPLICYDLRFPEVFAEGLQAGAGMFVVIANWLEHRHVHWKPLLVARAIENQAYVFGVNRCGRDPHVAYLGGSVAVDPMGVILAEAGTEETIVSAAVDIEALKTWRTKLPAWKTRGGW